LTGDETPLLARIVHVADAFDAMTSARAYRPARGSAEALAELWSHAGAQFDAQVVQALAGVRPQISATTTQAASTETPLTPTSRRMSLVGVGRS
jgi:HD-GYP domain-containing protein (c-di-GMP phosphodiesterase class II)